jgi:hypothetical protein
MEFDTSSSTCLWSVEVCLWSVEVVPQGPHHEEEVVFGYTYVTCEHYTPNIYRCIHI